MANEKGYRAECINGGATINLKKYREYYVYPNGKDFFYVSKLPYQRRNHFGCYHKLHFKLIDQIPDMEETTTEEIQEAEEVKGTISTPVEEVQMSLF